MTTNLLSQYHLNKNKVILATQECFKAFDTNVQKHLNNKTQDFSLSDTLSNMTDDAPYMKYGDVAIVNFQGFTVSNCSPLEELLFGAVSLQTFYQDVQEAVGDETVNQVVINFDSGGGYTQYGTELISLIQQLKETKPIISYCAGGMICSMAYKIASATSAIIVSPSARVGSIGTRIQYMSYTGASQLSPDGVTVSNLPDLGITVTTFQGGTEKTIGDEFIALNDQQKASILEDIQNVTNEFRNQVNESRGGVDEAFMQGQAFTGEEAMELNTNLIDGLANSMDELLEALTQETNN